MPSQVGFRIERLQPKCVHREQKVWEGVYPSGGGGGFEGMGSGLF